MENTLTFINLMGIVIIVILLIIVLTRNIKCSENWDAGHVYGCDKGQLLLKNKYCVDVVPAKTISCPSVKPKQKCTGKNSLGYPREYNCVLDSNQNTASWVCM